MLCMVSVHKSHVGACVVLMLKAHLSLTCGTGDNHFGWVVSGLIIQNDDMHKLTPAAARSLRSHGIFTKAAIRQFNVVLPFGKSVISLYQDRRAWIDSICGMVF